MLLFYSEHWTTQSNFSKGSGEILILWECSTTRNLVTQVKCRNTRPLWVDLNPQDTDNSLGCYSIYLAVISTLLFLHSASVTTTDAAGRSSVMELESLYYRLCNWSGRETVRTTVALNNYMLCEEETVNFLSIGCITLYCMVLCIRVMMQTDNISADLWSCKFFHNAAELS